MIDPLEIVQGDCVEVMRGMTEASVDAIVTDPPYGIGFMGHQWDQPGYESSAAHGYSKTAFADKSEHPAMEAGRYDLSQRGNAAFGHWTEAWAIEALRVLKPGALLLSFGGTRTYHRMTCAIEDAGFEVRDCLIWLYGSGFPKSLDVSKAFDKAAGAVGEIVSTHDEHDIRNGHGRPVGSSMYGDKAREAITVTRRAPASVLARRWSGWGTALKPAWEPIVLARKPLEGTVIENVERYGTGALNINVSRIKADDELRAPQSDPSKRAGVVGSDLGISRADKERFQQAQRESIERTNTLGRWPANVLFDEDAAAMLDEQSGESTSRVGKPRGTTKKGLFANSEWNAVGTEHDDRGGASRFFYTAKASKADRGEGNTHPTVKPVDLMRYLVRLVTPAGGLVLDPFAGSGTTGQAALAEGFRCILIERDAEYVQGIKAWRANMQLGHGL